MRPLSWIAGLYFSGSVSILYKELSMYNQGLTLCSRRSLLDL